MASYDSTDLHFQHFGKSLKRAIAICGTKEDEKFLERQERNVNELIALEIQFKQAIIDSPYGDKVFSNFVKYICEERRNILDARPYFRERQTIFTAHISKAFHYRDFKELQKFRLNYRWIRFAMAQVSWKPKSQVVILEKALRKVRNELITMNMPLAISRARIFYSRTPKAHLTYMDLVQIAAEGLISGVDKFVPPFSKAFRSVALGRITGNTISNYSETVIHFYPPDKRKIYRANKLAGRSVDIGDFAALANGVNLGADAAHQTNSAEIANLMAAASTVSTDTPVSDDDEEGVRVADRFAAPVHCQPDYIYENASNLKALSSATQTLTVLERKILRLKGIAF